MPAAHESTLLPAWCELFALLLAVFCSSACQCGGARVVARLEQLQGLVERYVAAAPGVFGKADKGAEFRLGDALRTGTSASALVVLSDGSHVALRESTLLRFSATPDRREGSGLEVETGTAELEVGPSGLRLFSSVGVAVLEAGTRIRIAPKQGGTSFVVLVGLAHVATRDGTRDVAANEELLVAIGGAVLESTSELGSPVPAERKAEVVGDRPVETATGISALVRGQRARTRTANETTWRALAPGVVRLEPGCSLEVGTGTKVELSQGSSQMLVEGDGSFVVAPDPASALQASKGDLTAHTSANRFAIAVPGGTILALPDARARVVVGATGGTKLSVGAGKIDVQSSSSRQGVAAGESAELSRAGLIRVNGRSLDYADLDAPAGGSFVVHDPTPPTAIRFALSQVCKQGGIVERLAATTWAALAGARGETAAALSFPAGESRYRVRCLEAEDLSDQASASGVVTIVKDSGNGPLSRVPPMTRIDMDGRSYTVVYQNLLPKLAARWKNAPKAAQYTLRVESRQGKRSISSLQPVHTFAAGQLVEGEYTLQFSAGEATSPATKVAVRFENASPTARILTPRDRAFSRGAAVAVTGIAAAGWSVSVAGRQLALDDQSRFSEEVVSSVEARALPIRFEHPLRGIHYYLRRANGVSP